MQWRHRPQSRICTATALGNCSRNDVAGPFPDGTWQCITGALFSIVMESVSSKSRIRLSPERDTWQTAGPVSVETPPKEAGKYRVLGRWPIVDAQRSFKLPLLLFCSLHVPFWLSGFGISSGLPFYFFPHTQHIMAVSSSTTNGTTNGTANGNGNGNGTANGHAASPLHRAEELDQA